MYDKHAMLATPVIHKQLTVDRDKVIDVFADRLDCRFKFL
jgi:energy-converting hydrogenase A subunit M